MKKSEVNFRFETILKLLKERDPNNTQVNIMKKLNLDFINDETYFSELKSGKRKKIPEKLIEGLHKYYNVNPEYLKLKSEKPFDDTNFKLENFLNFVADWKVLRSRDKNDNYLHLVLDQNFYDFLIEFDRVKEVSEEGLLSIEDGKKVLDELYSSTPSLQEYVLIPCNNFLKIAEEASNSKQTLNEVLDMMDYLSYLDSEETNTNSENGNAHKLKITLEQLDKFKND